MCSARILVFLAFSLLTIQANAQLNADFTADITSGCTPISVKFTDLSTGNPSSWNWDLGNGNTSNKKNPDAIYTTPGTYTVSLTISNGTASRTITKTAYIKVFANPVANFYITSANTGCQPLIVHFRDTSVSAGVNITQWTWDFGDGATSKIRHPKYTYNIPGTYTVALYVKDTNGCTGTKSFQDIVTVHPKPIPAFSTSMPVWCSPPANVNFTNNSTGSGALSSYWDFGDSSTSSQFSPNHQYNKYGNFSVKLVVTDQNGCRDSLVKSSNVRISNVKASIIFPSDTLCFGSPVQFTDGSNDAIFYTWDFGDGSMSILKNPLHHYSFPGAYTVKLTISDGKNCYDSTLKVIYLEPVEAKFTCSPTYSCKALNVNFFNKSVNAVRYFWYFGDGFTSTDMNPVHTYIGTGKYKPLLIAYSAHNCPDTFIFDSGVVITLPNADFIADKIRGCAPLEVHFTDASASNEPIVSWLWDFGDGQTSAQQNPVHTFVKDTIYNCTLTITNAAGCVGVKNFNIYTGKKPIIGFLVNPDTSCAFDSVSFKDTSLNISRKPNDEWMWEFGDGASGAGAQTSHIYTDTGWMKIRLIVGQNGCFDTLEFDSALYINGPVANDLIFYDCDHSYEFNFKHTHRGGHRWTIYFGDGDSLQAGSKDSVYHKYLASGDYQVKARTYNDSNGCIWENILTAYARNLSITLPPQGPSCAGNIAVFNNPVVKDADQVFWDYGDGTTDVQSSHYYGKKGLYRLITQAVDRNGCLKWDTQYIRIYKPEADFVLPQNACTWENLTFMDNSIPDTTIVSRFWSFGDGSTSTLKNPVKYYANSGVYSPFLIIYDAAGCSDTISKDGLIVNQPYAGFYTDDNTLCDYEKLKMENTSNGNNLKYLWMFGDGNTSAQEEPSHTYGNEGLYTITLIVTDSWGCRDTAVVPDYITVESTPSAWFYADTSVSTCYPLLVHFYDSTIKGSPIFWKWNFGDYSIPSFLQNPVHNYLKPGLYDVELEVSSANGCKDTILRKEYIRVYGPYAEFDIDPDTICAEEPVTFSIINKKDIAGFEVDMADGNVIPGSKDVFTYVYKKGGLLFPKMMYYDTGRFCRKFDEDTLMIYSVTADFIADKNSGEPPLDVSFTDKSSIEAISWYWNFQDGYDTNIKDPQHTFRMVGNYLVLLVVTNSYGCTDTAVQLIKVLPLSPIIDLPKAFTPGQPGENIVILNGYGSRYKELLEFKIYNRYGEVVFQTKDPEKGWDGYYKGELQNVETYAWLVRVKSYYDTVVEKKGFISLLR